METIENILIIDENKDDVELFKMYYKSRFNIRSYTGNIDNLDIIEFNPDLILVNGVAPLSGYEMCMKLREIGYKGLIAGFLPHEFDKTTRSYWQMAQANYVTTKSEMFNPNSKLEESMSAL